MVKEELMENWQQRTELLLGAEKMERLRKSHVLVVGLGGVGAYAAEMICRAGVGRMTIVDADIVQSYGASVLLTQPWNGMPVYLCLLFQQKHQPHPNGFQRRNHRHICRCTSRFYHLSCSVFGRNSTGRRTQFNFYNPS